MLFHGAVVFNSTPSATAIAGTDLIAFRSVQPMLLIHTICGWMFQGLHLFCHAQNKLDVPGLLSVLSSIFILDNWEF